MSRIQIDDPEKVKLIQDYCRQIEEEYNHFIEFDKSQAIYEIMENEDNPDYYIWEICIKNSYLKGFDHIHCYGLVNDFIQKLYDKS